uniref:THIF-type NAD/FAD binding fold domain-containing protein n=1 Tax=Pyramimonas obovata TaxID=1411642 RepID=A0A6T7UQZ2_9CHLO|mmetsp:Transcript_10207/g.21281  ORF Transcript_10207/g.21281 Transcript_10207/m.21281 type:complete len:328 (+) Transcript_10207:122-1105(+)|eukprot:CAMPEP_0118926182 /NCGR_PEP_ID=MMETSP1169-20130426/3939_1 /TAXON_ID=36882 /ORGANISM="Pyramimonas obovata, Strain CCMP722" /LENGTH=327 /DNA_ID=CAMNT_0006867685 /DNA_START=103 /DNA_END=1086 /DNA_ORIENTATION=-
MAEETAALTEEQAAVYDRQIRVWGVETQQRLGNARVLFVGCTGVVAETCKNVVLAGIGSVTLLDDRAVASANEPGNFLVTCDADPGGSVAQASVQVLKEMNPMVKIEAIKGPIEALPIEVFKSFDVIVSSGVSLDAQEKLNRVCRERGVKFLATSCHSSCGYFFFDLLQHTYKPQPKKKEDGDAQPSQPVEVKEENMEYVPLEEALSATHWPTLSARASRVYVALSAIRETERLLQRPLTSADVAAVNSKMCELAAGTKLKPDKLPADLVEAIVSDPVQHPAVAAIVGGFLGQEILKTVSAKAAPMQNFFFFDLESGDGNIERVPVA